MASIIADIVDRRCSFSVSESPGFADRNIGVLTCRTIMMKYAGIPRAAEPSRDQRAWSATDQRGALDLIQGPQVWTQGQTGRYDLQTRRTLHPQPGPVAGIDDAAAGLRASV